MFFVVNPVTKRVTMVQAGSAHGTSVEWSGQLVARGDDIIHLTLRFQVGSCLGDKYLMVCDTRLVVRKL